MLIRYSSERAQEFLYLIHLVVSGNVLVQSSQHDHGNHARQEEDDDQGVHNTRKKKHTQTIYNTGFAQHASRTTVVVLGGALFQWCTW